MFAPITTPVNQSDIQTHIEKVMMGLPSTKTTSERKMYLAGVIDTLFDTGQIVSDDRDAFYILYVG